MFSNISTLTKALFQQFELKISRNVFDPYQTDQLYEELNQDVHAGSSFDISTSEAEDMVLVDTIVDEKDACFINGYCIEQPSANCMHLIVVTAAKGIIKKVSTSASSAYSTAHSEKKKLQKKAIKLISNDDKALVMRGYGVDFCRLFEKPYDSNFCADLSDRNNRRNADADSENKYIDIPLSTLSSMETENNSWELA
ncbi:hypothetical protein MAM1_0208d08022 [Mucor ambiguus]|uniref:Uncharacterized protein n=1 Tax=Mucor ambiguus TaxID=91626 RepID=A0A0C9N1P3_9FUNG|nr:hypothetical protein MAM1_0208d08022 [Mucor ambiguus]